MAKTPVHEQIDQLFEKLAWPYDPAQVAAELHARGSSDAADVLRGQRIVDTAKQVGETGARAAKAVGRGVAHVLAPAHVEGRAVAGELGQLGSSLIKKPSLMRLGAGGLLLAPIMMGALHGTQQKREDELMNLQMSPERGFDKLAHTSLDHFLEKKAGIRPRWLKALARGDIASSSRENFVEGLGKGVGGGVALAILGAVGGSLGSAYDSLIVDPKRKKLFESIVRSDPVVSDAISRNPHATKTLAEAFQTMVRFAPSLSLDVNAVRSFLREAVVGGAAGVNYATIKSLIETEKAHSSKGGGNR